MVHGQLTLEGRISVFSSIAVSKLIHHLLITKVHNNAIDFLYKIQKNFIWQSKNAKIKHRTLRNGYEKGGIKMLTKEIRQQVCNALG